MNKIKVNVISRKTSNRRPTIQQDLESKNIPFTFFEAADKDNIQRNDGTFCHKNFCASINFDNNFGDSFKNRGWMKIGEVGCMYSHYCLWKELLSSDYDAYFILEDDAKVLFNNDTLNYFLNNEKLDGIDIVFCQRNSPNFVNGNIPFNNLTNDLSLVATQNVHYWQIIEGTTGYIVTRSGAEKFIKPFEQFGLLFPADNYIARCTQKAPIGVDLFKLSMESRLCPKYLQVELAETAKTSEIHDNPNENVTMIQNIKFKD